MWSTYRTLKSGLLLDFIVKRLFYIISQFFTINFTVFFGDKYILEHFMANLSKYFCVLSNKLKLLSNVSFLVLFRTTIIIVSYFFLLYMLIVCL